MEYKYTDRLLDICFKYKEGEITKPIKIESYVVCSRGKKWEGSLKKCGKGDCTESPSHFVLDLSSGIPRFLCQSHTERWYKKRRNLISLGTIYLYKINHNERTLDKVFSP